VMFKRFCLFVLFFPIWTFSGPIIVGGGAGESEFSVLFVHSYLQQIVEECGSFSCPLTNEEKTFFQDLVRDVKSSPSAIFKTSQDLKDRLFEIHDSVVWINQELLWKDAQKNLAYDIGDAAELWLKILAEKNQIDLSLKPSLVEKLKKSLMHESMRSQLNLDLMGTTEFILWKSDKADLLVLRDPALTTVVFTPLIAAALKCSEEPKALRVYSPAWMLVPSGETNRIDISLQFGVSWTCENQSYSSRGFSKFQIVAQEMGPARIDETSIDSFVE